MSSLEEIITRVAWQLDKFSPTVTREFRLAAGNLGSVLNEDQFDTWASEGLAIAANSYRSWESATEYYRASFAVLESLGFGDFLNWAHAGQDLAREAASLATAYFRASPDTVGLLSPEEIPAWARQGRGLYQEAWKAKVLSAQFYEISPLLLRCLSVEELDHLIHFLNTLTENAPELAAECLQKAGTVLGQMEHREREEFLAFASAIAKRNWRAARTLFQSGPRVLAAIDRDQRLAYLSLAGQFAQSSRDRAVSFFLECDDSFREVDRAVHGRVLATARRVLAASPDAAMEFIKVAPQALRRVEIGELEAWAREGILAVGTNLEAGLSYFRLESNRGQMALDRLSAGVELHEVRETLRMYGKALAARNVSIASTQELADKGLGWTAAEKATTDGSGIYLPSYIRTFASKGENRAAYKVLVTHQTGHLEFGSFDFQFDKPAAVFADWRPSLLAMSPRSKPAIAEFDIFFDLFPDRLLAKHIFTTAEDARIDHHVKADYKGIAGSYRQLQARALTERPSLQLMPLRQAVLEQTIRLALGQTTDFVLPKPYVPHFRAIARILGRLSAPGTTVEDAVEATARLYAIIAPIPNLARDALDALDSVSFGLDGLEDEESYAQLDQTIFDALSKGTDAFGVQLKSEDEEVPYEGPEAVGFWGDFKPEIVQALMKVKKDAKWRDDLLSSPLTAEELKALLLQSGELQVTEMGEDDLEASSGLFVTNLLNEGLKAKAKKKKQHKEREHKDGVVEGEPLRSDAVETFTYDEWDFRADDYKPDWCLVGQRPMEEGSVEFFENTLRNYASLVQEIKRQFELLRPELFRKLKRLRDGDEFELDAVIEAVVEKKAGLTPSDKLYSRRNKVERSVAVVFLLDMSASTDEEIKPPEEKPLFSPEEIDRLNRLGGWEIEEEPFVKGKRIIDLEKESLVLLIKALETIGDSYGIYGFSGHGRDNVEFYTIKDLEEAFDDRIKRRIDRVSPIRATRMGPAIRHATTKLEEKQAKVRLLILISDGRPQDHDYGRDRTEKEYGIHDTKMALVEAKRKGIIPFCLTVDKKGHDYLGAMCGDLGYEVVGDIESLPERLPTLYRKLTS